MIKRCDRIGLASDNPLSAMHLALHIDVAVLGSISVEEVVDCSTLTCVTRLVSLSNQLSICLSKLKHLYLKHMLFLHFHVRLAMRNPS